MADFSFQMFSPLRTPAKKRKKQKDRHSHEEPSQISAPNVSGSDSELDSEILKLAGGILATHTSPRKHKRKNSDSAASPRKQARIPETSSQPILSDVGGEVEGHQSQGLSPRALRMGLDRGGSPELFSDFGSEIDGEPSGLATGKLASPSKRKIHSQQERTPLDVTGSQRQYTQTQRESGNSGSSESDLDNDSRVKTCSQSRVKATQSNHALSDSESDSECEHMPKTSSQGMQLSPRKALLHSNSSHAEAVEKNSLTSSNSNKSLSNSKSELQRHSEKERQQELRASHVRVVEQALRYACPLGFKEVEFTGSSLRVEDVADDDEIWIMRIPTDYDMSKLDGKRFSMDTVVQLGQRKGSDVNYELHSSKSKGHKTSLLLPSNEDGKLHYVGQVMGQMWLSESHSIPSITMPNPKPPRETGLPPGLKYRNVAFGAGTLSPQSEVPVRTRRKKEKKSKRKSKEALTGLIEETQDTPEESSQTVHKKKKKKKQKDVNA